MADKRHILEVASSLKFTLEDYSPVLHLYSPKNELELVFLKSLLEGKRFPLAVFEKLTSIQL
jgi:hypothetical protein